MKLFFSLILRVDALPAALAFVYGWVFSFTPGLTLLFGLCITLIDIGWLIIAGVLILQALCRKSWLTLSARLVALLMALPVGIVCAQIPDYMHLAVMWSDLRALSPGQPQVFEWGQGGMVPATFTRYLVYVPDGRTIYEALLSKYPGLTDQNATGVTHLFGPYYVVQCN